MIGWRIKGARRGAAEVEDPAFVGIASETDSIIGTAEAKLG